MKFVRLLLASILYYNERVIYSAVLSVIVWKLNELMLAKGKRSADLARFLGVDPNSVYRIRKQSQMPRLTGETLEGICLFLECQPGDLLEVRQGWSN